MSELTTLANAGLTGVAIALIIALVVIVKAVLTMVGNHMKHNTESNEKLVGKIEQFIDIVKEKL